MLTICSEAVNAILCLIQNFNIILISPFLIVEAFLMPILSHLNLIFLSILLVAGCWQVLCQMLKHQMHWSLGWIQGSLGWEGKFLVLCLCNSSFRGSKLRHFWLVWILKIAYLVYWCPFNFCFIFLCLPFRATALLLFYIETISCCDAY